MFNNEVYMFEDYNQNDKFYKNICYLNSTRRKITHDCCERFIKEFSKRFVPIEFKYDNKKGK